MELADTASRSQGKKDLTGGIPERTRGEMFEGRTPKKRENTKKIPRRYPRGRERTFDTKRLQEVMKHRTRRQLRVDKAKSRTKHKATGHDRRVGKMKGATKVKEKVSHFRERRT